MNYEKIFKILILWNFLIVEITFKKFNSKSDPLRFRRIHCLLTADVAPYHSSTDWMLSFLPSSWNSSVRSSFGCLFDGEIYAELNLDRITSENTIIQFTLCVIVCLVTHYWIELILSQNIVTDEWNFVLSSNYTTC